MSKTLQAISIAATMLGLTSCYGGNETESFRGIKNAHTVWVFTQLNVDNEEDGIDSFYYYGRISETLYDRIKSNETTSGFLLLEDVRYYSDVDDKVHPYKNDEKKGELVFRIEDIKRLQLLSQPPQMDEQEQDKKKEKKKEQKSLVLPATPVEPESVPKQPAIPKKAD